MAGVELIVSQLVTQLTLRALREGYFSLFELYTKKCLTQVINRLFRAFRILRGGNVLQLITHSTYLISLVIYRPACVDSRNVESVAIPEMTVPTVRS